MQLRSGSTTIVTCTITAVVALGVVLPASASQSPATHAAPAGAPWSTSAPGSSAEPGEARGRWEVALVGADRYTVAWTSPSQLPVTDARPEIITDGAPVGVATLRPDGRTVEVTIQSPSVPDVAHYDVVLSDQTLDSVAEPVAGDVEPYRKVAQAAELPIADDPGVPGAHPTQSSDYRLPAVKLPDIRRKSEMLGHVVEPTDADDTSPLVLFLHGRHSPCYEPAAKRRGDVQRAAATGDWKCTKGQAPIPSYLGYDYVQQLLASQGYVTVSISANAINDLDFDAMDGGATARAALIRAHLRAWADFVTAGTRHADLSNVILVGHSRGGEGANRASLDRRADDPYDINGQVLIGPTDFGFQAAPSTPTVTLLPYCDGDVSDLQGQEFTDAARDLTDEIAFHSSVLVMGANHNFFNTEWTPGLSVAPSGDDWGVFGPGLTKTCGRKHPMRLSKQGQQDVGSAYIAGAVRLFADNDQSVLPMYDGSAVTVASAGDADVRSHAIGGGLEIRRPGLDASLAPAPSAAARLCTGQADAARPQVCELNTESSRTPHWPASYIRGVSLRRAWEMSWTAVDQESGLALNEPWDLTSMGSLDLRTIVRPGQGPADLKVRLSDGSGGTAVVLPDGDGRLVPLPGGAYQLAKRWAQDLRVPLAGVAGVDLSDITSVGLVSANAAGRVWVLDVTAHPTAALPAPPTVVLPTVSLGEVSQKEGDGKAEATLEIPYTVGGGPTQADATVRVIRADDSFSYSGKPWLMEIPAGTESGTLSIPYRPNTLDDLPRTRKGLVVFPVEGIATNRYVGGGTVIDDDPAPRLTIKPLRKRIHEGATARWVVTLSKPTGYWTEIIGRPVRGPGKGKRLTVGDLSKEFRENNLYPVPPLKRALYKTELYLYGGGRAGRTRFVVTVPTRASKKHQGDRSITIRFHPTQQVRAGRLTQTIVVTD